MSEYKPLFEHQIEIDKTGKEFDTSKLSDTDKTFSVKDLMEAPNIRSFIILVQEYSKPKNKDALVDVQSKCVMSSTCPDIEFILERLLKELPMTDPAAGALLPLYSIDLFMKNYMSKLINDGFIEFDEKGHQMLMQSVTHILQLWMTLMSNIGVVDYCVKFVNFYSELLEETKQEMLENSNDLDKIKEIEQKYNQRRLDFLTSTTYNIVSDMTKKDNFETENDSNFAKLKQDDDNTYFMFGENYSKRRDN